MLFYCPKSAAMNIIFQWYKTIYFYVSQLKFISLNLPTRYLRRYAKQYHFILVQIKVTEPQMICLYKTNQRGGSGDTTLLNKSYKRKLPSYKLNLHLLICQRSICGDTQNNIISYLCK